jgi:AbrB family looped-hinge helix DNA binding protein
MSATVVIDDAGRLMLPQAIREQFNLTCGSRLRIRSTGNHFELTPVAEDESDLVERDGLLVVSATGTPCNASEAVELERECR